MTADASFRKYPYFLYPQAEALASATDLKERETLARRVAAYIGDPISLRALLGLDPEEFACFYPDQGKAELSTNDTISSFLQRFGKGVDSDEIPVAPAVDYATILDRLEAEADAPMPSMEDNGASDSTSAAIDSFLAAVPPSSAQATSERNTAVPSEEKCSEPISGHNEAISEKRARVLIREGNYVQALEIITRLQLRDSENPCYADQIRFLRKLILNSGRKNGDK